MVAFNTPNSSTCAPVGAIKRPSDVPDGRFIAPTGAQVLELGVLNATIHQINEHVNIDELEPLAEIYEQILVELLA